MSSEPGLRCIGCGEQVSPEVREYLCAACGDLLEVASEAPSRALRDEVDGRFGAGPSPLLASGVWRYRELVLPVPDEELVSRGEGGTHLYGAPGLADWAGIARLHLKHEGENPTGSFKDRGMTVAVTQARRLGVKAVACASTGNTSASMASYAARAGIPSFVFVPAGKVARGKLSQALAYGGHTVLLRGDFDAALRRVRELCRSLGIYLVNSVNPYRIEGQKTIMIEALHQLGWEPPDWIVVPGGNLGNTAAFGKALGELHEAGWISRLPRLAVIQAEGANPFYRMITDGLEEPVPVAAETIATAIRIGAPVSWKKARRSLELTDGVVEQVSDAEILAAKAAVDAAGVGAEPASCASLAGLRKLRERGVVASGATAVAVLTGHLLKDPDTTVAYHLAEEGEPGPGANPPVEADDDPVALEALVRARLESC